MTQKVKVNLKGLLADEKATDFDLFTLWKEYEAIAMHFNDLLLKIRTQSLAAVAAFATVAGVLLKGESVTHALRWGILTAVFFALSVFWIAIWILDFTYYNRLLLGAVNALVQIEAESKKGSRTNEINVSTFISDTVQLKHGRESLALAKGRVWFYSMVFGLLVTLMGVSVWQYNSPPPEQVRKTGRTARDSTQSSTPAAVPSAAPVRSPN